MKIIYKYNLTVTSMHTVKSVPLGAKFLTLQVQRGVPCVWFLVDYTWKHTQRADFVIVPTGEQTELLELYDYDYVGTFQLSDERLVYHVFLNLEVT